MYDLTAGGGSGTPAKVVGAGTDTDTDMILAQGCKLPVHISQLQPQGDAATGEHRRLLRGGGGLQEGGSWGGWKMD